MSSLEVCRCIQAESRPGCGQPVAVRARDRKTSRQLAAESGHPQAPSTTLHRPSFRHWTPTANPPTTNDQDRHHQLLLHDPHPDRPHRTGTARPVPSSTGSSGPAAAEKTAQAPISTRARRSAPSRHIHPAPVPLPAARCPLPEALHW
jgi:hypothetical protein